MIGVTDGEPNTKKHSKVRVPLIEAMEAYHALDMAPYHTPGHKHGVTVHPSMRTMLTEKGLGMDVSLIPHASKSLYLDLASSNIFQWQKTYF